jgi:glyoxylase-like metal-dependent hydrolase (beta-lactamase superfamily II)
MHERLLFTGDTVLAGGVLSGILGSGNISDYISSLVRLNTLRVEELYPGHGKISFNPHDDLEKALQAAQSLLVDTKILFETLDTESTYEQYFADLRKFPTPPRR